MPEGNSQMRVQICEFLLEINKAAIYLLKHDPTKRREFIYYYYY